jgi:hypothetical protein
MKSPSFKNSALGKWVRKLMGSDSGVVHVSKKYI